MTLPYNPVGFNPLLQAEMPNDYTDPTNFGSYGANPNAQGWGLNSSYLTPNFLAPYRPQYAGNPNFRMPSMSMGASALAISPFGARAPYYADPQMYMANAATEFGNKLVDAPMAGAQILSSVAVGLATAAAFDSFRFTGLGGSQQDIRAMSYGLRSGLPSWLGGASTLSQARYLSGSQTILEAGGRAVGGTAGRAVGLAISGGLQSASMLLRGGKRISGLPSFASGLGRVGAFGGAVAGSLALPFMLAEGVSQTFDRAVFAPYVAGRQATDMVQDSLRGTYTGQGSLASPLTMTNMNATGLGFDLSRTMTENNSFGIRAAADIYSNASAAGLFKGTGFGKEEMKKRMKDVTESVSLIMSVFNDPSTQDAISRLSQLSHGGGLKNYMDIGALASKYRMASAVTGIGTRELMAGVGQQGQLMYAQAGLAPFLGQYSALNAMSGISAGYRAGLISGPSLAMMGGAEGASQLSMQAQLGLASTPYFSMTAFNRGRGGSYGSMTANIAAFGQSMASNPVKTYGEYILNSGVNVSNMLKEDPSSILRQIHEHARTIPGSYDSEGKLYVGAAAAIGSRMGIGVDQMRAILEQIRGEHIVESSGQRAVAFEQSKAAMFSTNNMTYYSSSGPGRVVYDAMRAGKRLDNTVSKNFSQPIAEFQARVSDMLTNFNYGLSAAYSTPAELRSLEGMTEEELTNTTVKNYSYDMDKYHKLMGTKNSLSDRAVGGLQKLAAGTALTIGGAALIAAGGWLPLMGGLTLGGTGLATSAVGGIDLGNSAAGLTGGYKQPNAKMTSLIRALDIAAKKNPSLAKGLENPSHSKIVEIASTLGIDNTQAKQVAALYSSKSETTSSISIFDEYMKSAANTMDLAFEAVGSAEFGIFGGRKLTDASIGRLSSFEEKATLLAFAAKYRGTLSNPNAFLMAVKQAPAVEAILTRMGYGQAFTGSGPEAELAAREAMQAVNAMSSAGGISDPKLKILETAAVMSLTGEKDFSKNISLSDLRKNLDRANKAVMSTHLTYSDVVKSARLAADNPNSLINTANASVDSINASLTNLGTEYGKLNWEGLMQATASKNMEAANKIYAAAEKMEYYSQPVWKQMLSSPPAPAEQ